MRCVRLTKPGRPLEDRLLNEPVPAGNEILIDVRAAGICHSDAHYRAGRGRVTLPLTPGHEIAGLVAAVGNEVSNVSPGDRVAVHYLLSCGTCDACTRGGEQFCVRGAMIGKECNGGFAERVVIPARNAVPIPDSVPFEEAAVMMCSTATVYHALRMATPLRGQAVLILGFGGLGISALQLAKVFGAEPIIAVDVVPEKLAAASSLGALTIDGRTEDLAAAVRSLTQGRGADVVLDLAGHAAARLAALRSLAPGGRLMLIALDTTPFAFEPYADLLTRERQLIGCSDHLLAELLELMELAARGDISLAPAITRRVPLEARAINEVLDDLDRGTSHLRTVVVR